MNPIRVLLVDDHSWIRRGVRSLLSLYEDITVVGEAQDGPEALQAVRDLSPDVILLDIHLPGPEGLELIRLLRDQAPQAKVIVLTAYDHQEYVVSALQAGARAYLLKSTSDQHLIDCIRRVSAGDRLLSPSLIPKVLREFQAVSAAYAESRLDLDKQELEILALIASGSTTKGIAERTHLSDRSIKRRIRSIKEKLGVSSRAEAVAEAIKQGLI